jgi:hypothetical protein
MRTSLVALAVVITWILVPTAGQAGWKEFWRGVQTDTCRNNCWYEPFNHIDRQDMQAHLNAMVAKGWQMQNTLSHYHFDPQTNQANRSAEAKLMAIINHNPPHRRTVFVVRSLDPDITAARVDSIQQMIAQIVPAGEMPAVVQTDAAPVGRYAAQMYAEFSKWDAPAPVLPSSSGSGD